MPNSSDKLRKLANQIIVMLSSHGFTPDEMIMILAMARIKLRTMKEKKEKGLNL